MAGRKVSFQRLEQEFRASKPRDGVLVVWHRPTRFQPFERPVEKDNPFVDTYFIEREDDDPAARSFRILGSSAHFARTGERRPDGWMDGSTI